MGKPMDQPTPDTEAPSTKSAPVPKSWYYLPEYDMSVEASSLEEAVKLAEKQVNG